MADRALGRGMADILGRGGPGASEVKELDVALIEPNRNQPRTHFDENELAKLADSISRSGILQPILVRPHGGGYELVAGERRLRAAQELGLGTIPAVVREMDEQESLEISLVENIQREDLNPIERGLACRGLMERFDMTQEQVAEAISKDRSTVANLIRILDLPDYIKEDVSRGTLTMGHARALLSVSAEEQREMRDRIVNENLSVRETEAETSGASGKGRRKPQKPSHIRELEERMMQRLGTKVALRERKGRGRIVIEFYTLDDLDRILGIIG